MKSYRKNSGGYTLVEITLVIVIIAMISSVVLISVQSARTQSRDAQRKSDLANIQIALRLYKDANGRYPSCGSGMVIGESQTLPGGCATNIDTALAPYLPSIPRDPMANGSTYSYIYDSDYDCRFNGNSSDETVVYAVTAEKTGNQNWGRNPTVPGACEPTGPVNQIYGVVLGPEVP